MSSRPRHLLFGLAMSGVTLYLLFLAISLVCSRLKPPSSAAVRAEQNSETPAPDLVMTSPRQEGDLEFYAGEAGAIYMRGIDHQNKKEHEAAIKDFSAALQLDSKRSVIYQSRATAYDILGKSEEALADYSQAIQFNSMDPAALSSRGMLLTNMGRLAEAKADCERLKILDAAAAASLCRYVENR